jgi:hypothetical protein
MDWLAVFDERSGREYYYNNRTLETRWELPSEWDNTCRHVEEIQQVCHTSRILTCIRIGIHARLSSLFQRWKRIVFHSEFISRRMSFVSSMASLLSAWMRMRDMTIRRTAEALQMQEDLLLTRGKLIVLEKVEAATQEWERLLSHAKQQRVP